jgi:hypothetical protein
MRASPGDRRLHRREARLLKLGRRASPRARRLAGRAAARRRRAPRAFSRVAPGDPAWPDAARWKALEAAVGGSLLALRPPFADCVGAASAPAARNASPRRRIPTS